MVAHFAETATFDSHTTRVDARAAIECAPWAVGTARPFAQLATAERSRFAFDAIKRSSAIDPTPTTQFVSTAIAGPRQSNASTADAHAKSRFGNLTGPHSAEYADARRKSVFTATSGRRSTVGRSTDRSAHRVTRRIRFRSGTATSAAALSDCTTSACAHAALAPASF